MGRKVSRGLFAIEAHNDQESGTRTCLHCNSRFNIHRKGHEGFSYVYCSDRCMEEHREVRNEPCYCKICGRTITYKSEVDVIYCSIKCSDAHKQIVAKQQEKKERKLFSASMPLRDCKICKNPFTPSVAHQVYCSDKCRGQARQPNERDKWIIFNRDNFQCFYCGRTSFSDRAELHVDHIFPRRKGGKDVASNLVTACSECNLAKHTTEPNIINELKSEVRKRNEEAGISGQLSIKGFDRKYVGGEDETAING